MIKNNGFTEEEKNRIQIFDGMPTGAVAGFSLESRP